MDFEVIMPQVNPILVKGHLHHSRTKMGISSGPLLFLLLSSASIQLKSIEADIALFQVLD